MLNRLFANTFWWTIGILLLVELLIVYSMIRFRARPGQPKPKQVHGNVKLEFLWTVIPAVIVLFISIPTIQTTFETQRRAGSDALTVEVIGHQWWWEFRYPEYGVVTANELYLPVGREIHLAMHSADVIHSFWIPRVGGKRDVNPRPRGGPDERSARSNHLTFNIEQPGYYYGQCAEFCGISHAIMRMAIVAVSPAEFTAWVQAMGATADATTPVPAPPVDTSRAAGPTRTQSTAPSPLQGPATPVGPQSDVVRGQQIFTSKVCIACHTVQGTTARGVLGPNLTRFGARRYVGAGARPNTQANVEAWIRDPQSLKPGVLMPGAQQGGGGMPPSGLSEDEIRAIAAYLVSLK
ncbi:MAG: cytochrome c oxidase subunit II [Longimicrobiales bacterium]